MDCVLATLLQGEDATEFQITHQEMIKGIAGHGYRSTLVIPIIENTPHEADLADSLADAIRRYPETTAVLVRRHGIYIWGKTWMQAKTQAECYHYLFRLAVEMHRLGIDYTATPRGDGATLSPAMLTKEKEALLARGEGMGCCSGAGGGELQGSHALNGSHENAGRYEKSGIKHVLMDIEGTTTSIDFVHQVLFPYASAQVGAHVREKLAENDPEVLGDIQALRDGCPEGCPPIPEEGGEGGREGLMEAVVKNVRWQMERDLKTTALKRLQGHIWRAGYAKGALHSHVYEDVPGALARWTQGGKGGVGGVKLAIYSSGSREAQRLLFEHTEAAGDLRRYLNCYFDTSVGGKREVESYRQIASSLGVSGLYEVLFLTDVVEEGLAAREAGMRVLLSVRPGNAEVDEEKGKGFVKVTSFEEVDAFLEGRVSFPI